MIIYLPVLVCLIGLIVYLICTRPPGNSPVAELGRIMFGVGLLVSLLQIPGTPFHILR